jgi:Flp pilus assembly protein TadD
VWEEIGRRSREAPAAVAFVGLLNGRPVSRASVRIQTSKDPVGAPIFYRDVPLMPVETETGVIKPLSPYAVRLVKWRLREVSQPESRVVMERLPVCANCHSFSSDGARMGMDLDGLRNNKGRYFLAGVQPETTVRPADVLQWSTAEGRVENPIRAGFMSQIAPDGGTVVTTIDAPGARASNYYVANFTDYRFLQVFFPTRGILAWYNRAAGVLQPLPGADDPAYVQFGAVWSPRGDYLVFARARAQDPNPPGRAPARFANDPNELQIQYDLYRVPFNQGRGGRAEPVAGASANGMSNTFPKLSPDGRWLVYVRSRNGQLMRPDSQLYIVPAAGGEARRMNCNTPLMNSWHSFSPNSRWMVFASKARSPYTQMYLTHIDENGRDTPPILIENATASNRAVNLPEFVNIPPGRLQQITGPALDYYRLYDRAVFHQKEKRYAEAADRWRALLEIAPDDAEVRRRLGLSLLLAGRRAEAQPYLEQSREERLRGSPLALAIYRLEQGREPPPVEVSAAPSAQERYYLALLALRRGAAAEAVEHLRAAIEAGSDYGEAHAALAAQLTDPAEALAHWRAAVRLQPNNAKALLGAAWILATRENLRDGEEALALARRALLANPKDAEALKVLAAAFAESGRFEDAVSTARRALALGPGAAVREQLVRYESRRPWRE